MSQFWNQLKDRVQARGAQANSTIGIIGGADGPTAVFVSTKPDSWLGTLLGLLPWGTGIISAGLLLGWCHKDKKRLLLPMILSTVGCAVGAEQAAVQAAAVWQAAKHMPEIPMPGAMLRTAAANAFSTGCGSARPRWYGLWRCCSAAAHPELHPCAAPYNKSREYTRKTLVETLRLFFEKEVSYN